MSLKKKEFCTMRMMIGRKEQHTNRISFFFEDSSCALWIDVESETMPEEKAFLLALWGNKNWPPCMKVKKMENLKNKRG